MVATAGYQAGVEANDTVLSYLQEVTWGEAPTGQYRALRMTSETLRKNKQRARPAEINPSRVQSAGVTNQEGAAGDIGVAYSYGTYDDLLSGLLGGEWSTPQATITGASGDIALSAAGVLTSTTANKFNAVSVGQLVRLAGFANAGNLGVYMVTAKASALSITLAPAGAPFVAETPAGSAAQLRFASVLTNGKVFKSFHVQKRLGAASWKRYPGSFIGRGTLSAALGQFLTGSLSLMCKDETVALVDASTGSILPAPTGRVHDNVRGFRGLYLDAVKIPATVRAFNATISNDGAEADYGMGDPAGQGMRMGTMAPSASMQLLFRNHDLWNRFNAETQGPLVMVTADAAGNAYGIRLPAAAIMNPEENASGPNAPILATYQIEANADANDIAIAIERFPA